MVAPRKVRNKGVFRDHSMKHFLEARRRVSLPAELRGWNSVTLPISKGIFFWEKLRRNGQIFFPLCFFFKDCMTWPFEPIEMHSLSLIVALTISIFCLINGAHVLYLWGFPPWVILPSFEMHVGPDHWLSFQTKIKLNFRSICFPLSIFDSVKSSCFMVMANFHGNSRGWYE